MNSLRYWVALSYTLLVPPGILVWLLVHPFVHLWRRIGPAWTVVLLGAATLAGATGLFAIRRTLLAVQFGTCWPLFAAGIAVLLVAVRLRILLHRHFSNRQLLGFPELAPDRYPQRLVTEGLHGRVRHPRYLQFLLVAASSALIANYLALYLLLALLMPAICLVVILEEKELRERFGPAYEEYSRRVPRFIPHWRGRG
jgi:protein-S-isoprenylcysteine O-methyltransferase Ste14